MMCRFFGFSIADVLDMPLSTFNGVFRDMTVIVSIENNTYGNKRVLTGKEAAIAAMSMFGKR